jgi:hypothetical protein
VARGGFAILYSHGTGYRSATYQGTGTVGYSASPSFTSSTTGDAAFLLSSGLPSYSAPPTISGSYGTYYTSSTHGSAATMSYADPYLGDRAPYAETWNFGIEHQLTKSITVKVNYLGSQGHFLPASNSGGRGYWGKQVNPSYYTLGSLLSQTYTSTVLAQVQAINPLVKLPYTTYSGTIAQMLTTFPQYSGVNDTYDSVANSNYHAVVFAVNQRMSHGLDFMVNVVHGAEIDDEGTFRSGFLSSRLERSRGIADTPNTIRGYAVYNLPFGNGHAIGSHNPIARYAASDWSISGIYTYSSGVPLAIVGSGCVAPGGGQCMPNYNTSFSGPVKINGKWGANATASHSPSYVNINAFTNAIPSYTFGNVARTAPYGLRGPANYDTDISVKKTIQIHDRYNAVFDISAYNVTNSVIFSVAGVNTGTTSTFGTVNGQANNSRDIQLAFRFNF